MSEDSLELEYGGLWPRVAASIIDALVLIPIGLLSLYNLFSIKSMLFMIFITILASLYKPLMEWKYGATLGKIAVKLKTVSDNFEPLSIHQAFGRYMPWIISQALSLLSYYYIFQSPIFQDMDNFAKMAAVVQETPTDTVNSVYNFIFLVMIGSLVIDQKKQGIHDKIAKTFVIKVNK